ncbi:hypothetical protein D8I24_3252 (plasmid) [Cupriavidus necator H850]|nr:hypothetical protein D8I24_3252 [Cupriavidus necator H850]
MLDTKSRVTSLFFFSDIAFFSTLGHGAFNCFIHYNSPV